MVMRIGEPTIQDLGTCGGQYRLRVAWPIDRLREDKESQSPDITPGVDLHLGYCGLVLMMDPNNMPRYATGMSIAHFDVGRAWQDKVKEDVERRAEAVVLDRLKIWASTTQHGEAASEVNAILDSVGESHR